jgi:hypothetical protein
LGTFALNAEVARADREEWRYSVGAAGYLYNLEQWHGKASPLGGGVVAVCASVMERLILSS